MGATFESKTFDSEIEYSYPPNGQIETIEQSGPNATSKFVKYTYNLSGQTTQIERSEPQPPSGNPPANTSPVPVATTTIGYRDAQGKKTNRVQSMSHTASNSTLGSGTSLASYSLGWDLGGRLGSMTSTADQAVTYTYDHNDQLKSATYQKLAYADLSFSCDANGNRNGGGNTPGPDNRQASDGVSDFAYDLDGNMTRRTNKTTGAVVEYTWDLRNRLTDVTFKSSASGPATKKVHYTYDALNRRIGTSVDKDGTGTLDQVDWFANRGLRTDRENAGDEVTLRLNASGNVTGRYLHGASVDEILAEENIASDGKREVLWPLADQQGSVRDIVRVGTNGQATVVDHIMYGPFGEKVAETDTAITHLYGYTGREYDKETGLQYNRARYYDPKLGRWMSKDPIGFDAGDTNLYRMTGNHATYASDPSGLAERPFDTSEYKPSEEFNEALYWARQYIKTAQRIETVLAKHAGRVRVANSRGILANNPHILRHYEELRDRDLRPLNHDLDVFATSLSGDFGQVEIPSFLKWHDYSITNHFEGGRGPEKFIELAFWLSENGVELGESYSPGGGLQNVTIETAMMIAPGGASFLQKTLAGVTARKAAIQAVKENVLGTSSSRNAPNRQGGNFHDLIVGRPNHPHAHGFTIRNINPTGSRTNCAATAIATDDLLGELQNCPPKIVRLQV